MKRPGNRNKNQRVEDAAELSAASARPIFALLNQSFRVRLLSGRRFAAKRKFSNNLHELYNFKSAKAPRI
jgi:hypothetical protein